MLSESEQACPNADHARPERVAVTGCRVTSDGLHLGHLHGSVCFASSLRFSDTVFWVLSDIHSGSDYSQQRATFKMAAEILAAANSHDLKILPVRESALRRAVAPLYIDLLPEITRRRLDDVYPSASPEIPNNLKLIEYLFPVGQVAYTLGLGAHLALYNDDNRRFVDLARLLAKRVNRAHGSTLHTCVRLPVRQYPRLLGRDGRRMANANGNVLRVRASSPQIRNFVRRLVATCEDRSTEVMAPYFESFRIPESSFGAQGDVDADFESLLQGYVDTIRGSEVSDAEAKDVMHSSESEATRRIGLVLARSGY